MSQEIITLTQIERVGPGQAGPCLEYFTIGYNSLEGPIAVGAVSVAGSIALVGFGFDSMIEGTSGVLRGAVSFKV
jgi:hypothetical protein